MAQTTDPTGDGWGREIDWMGRHERSILLMAVAFQLLLLLGMIAWQSVPHWTGENVSIRVVPIDPRDLMRGDYVVLSYEMSNLPVEGLGIDRWSWPDEQPVFVTLARDADGKHWHGVKASTRRPSSGKYIKGKTNRGRLIFGIESYFLQEGEGKEYEIAIRNNQVSAVIALSPDGRASLVNLKIGK